MARKLTSGRLRNPKSGNDYVVGTLLNPRSANDGLLLEKLWRNAIDAFDKGAPRYLAIMLEKAPTLPVWPEARADLGRIIRAAKPAKTGRPGLDPLQIRHALAMLDTLDKIEAEQMKNAHAMADRFGQEPAEVRAEIRANKAQRKDELAARLGVKVSTLGELRKTRRRKKTG